MLPCLWDGPRGRSRDRAVAQLGSAPRSGRGGRRFKSCQPDHRCPPETSAGPGSHGSGPCVISAASGTLRRMADEERGTDGPSLELPSLSFGRKRRKKAAQAAPEPPPPPAPEPEPEHSPKPTRPPAP